VTLKARSSEQEWKRGWWLTIGKPQFLKIETYRAKVPNSMTIGFKTSIAAVPLSAINSKPWLISWEPLPSSSHKNQQVY